MQSQTELQTKAQTASWIMNIDDGILLNRNTIKFLCNKPLLGIDNTTKTNTCKVYKL